MPFRRRPKVRACLSRSVMICFFCILAAPHCRGQAGANALSGTITSTSGSPIPNAVVSIKNRETARAKSVSVLPDGTFAVSALPPADYEITASAPGFAPTVTTRKLTEGSSLVVNLMLQAVGSGAPLKAPVGSAVVNGVVGSKSVSDLPLNGRSASDLATLEPGVATARTQASGQAQRGFGNQMTISGGRPRQNDSRLDGISLNDYVNGPPGSALGVNLGAEAVEQFSVLTSNYPAQYGRSSGGIIAATTRSGSRQFHGDVFEYLRNSALDARNFFDTSKPPFRRNQFGASGGGPIWKSRTFLFAAYEGLRQSQGVTQVNTVPSKAARDGHLCAPPDCGSTNTVNVDSQASRFLQAFYPLPHGALLCPFASCLAGAGDTGVFTFAGQQVTPENYFTVKIDHQLSGKDSLSGTYLFDQGSVAQPDALNNRRTGYNSRRQLYTVRETHCFTPLSLNAFRFGVSRVVANTGLTFPSRNPSASDPSFATVPGQNAPAIFVPGLTQFTGGIGAAGTYNFHWTSIQAYDDFSWTRGAHSLKIGGGLEKIRDNVLASSDPAGSFAFNSLSDFLSNKPFSLTAEIPGAIFERGFRQTIAGAYFEDDWRFRPYLTVNLGLRYEMSSVPTEVHGNLTVLRRLTDATPHLGDPLFANPTLRNFEPRLGISWDPFHDGMTALSAGFGVFDVLPLPYLVQFNELFSAPFFKLSNASNLPSGSFPNAAFDFIAASPNAFRHAYFDPQPRRNYVMQWNLTLTRDLTKDISLGIGYVGSRGVHQPLRVEDADIVMPTLSSQGYLWPAPIGSGTRLNLNAGRVTSAFWEGNSFYDALQFHVKANIGKGAQIGGSYTWGKTIDTSSGSIVGDEYSNSIASPLWFNPKTNRGLADFHVAQNLSVNYTWDLGRPRWARGFSAGVLGGWQVGGLVAVSTGVPFTPGFAGDALGLRSSDPGIDVPNLSSGAGCRSLVNSGNSIHYINTQCFVVPAAAPGIAASCVNVINIDPATGTPIPDTRTCLNLRGNLGRNTLIGPGLANFDFSVFKNNYIKRVSDSFNIQFRAEFFNILNHTNFAPPLENRNVFDSGGHPIANAGLITSTQTPSRQIQFAVKVIW
jgi:hypothetical protein